MSESAISSRPHIVVLGHMGVGKSTLGVAVADALATRYVDSDDDITKLFGITGADLAQSRSVAELHALEAGLLLGALTRAEPSVITAAASVVENELVRDACARRAFVIWLTADLDEIHRRQAEGKHRRPMDRNQLAALAERRHAFFKEMADVELDANQPPEALVAAVLSQLPDNQTEKSVNA